MSCPKCDHRLTLLECLPRFLRGPRKCRRCATPLYVDLAALKHQSTLRHYVIPWITLVVIVAATLSMRAMYGELLSEKLFVLGVGAFATVQAVLLGRHVQRHQFRSWDDAASRFHKRHLIFASFWFQFLFGVIAVDYLFGSEAGLGTFASHVLNFGCPLSAGYLLLYVLVRKAKGYVSVDPARPR